MQLDQFLVTENATFRDALNQIEKNEHGIIFVTALNGCVVGLATDGDIRRSLIEGRSLDESIAPCLNSDFVWAAPDSPREMLLKQLDHKIRVVPLLNAERKLVGIVSRDQFPVQAETPVYARSRSPVRVSFGGGGSDLTRYFSEGAGAVINTTISLYSHATLRLRNDKKIFIKSLDLNDSLYADELASALVKQGRFGLVQALLKAISPNFGFDLYLHSDYPMNSGLGGSAVVSAAVLGCFNQFRRDQWDLHELAEIAYQAERLYHGVAGGWQDQYATVFGGFNFMEFRMDQNIVHPLRIHPDTLCELEESLVLCDTRTTHDSGEIHQDQMQQLRNKDIRSHVNANVELSYRMRNDLLRGNLAAFGNALHDAWELKRQLSDKVSNPRLDDIYNSAREHGAAGGKLLGAGGGGFFLFYVPAFRKHELIESLDEAGIKNQPFRFEEKGLSAWTSRE